MRAIVRVGLLVLALVSALSSADELKDYFYGQGVRQLVGEGIAAAGKKDYAAAAIAFKKALQIAPDPHIQLRLASVQARLGEKRDALALLNRVAELKLGYDIEHIPAFATLKDDPEYKALVAKFAAGDPVRVRSEIAHVIRDPKLIPEGLAYDAATQTLYVGSLNKQKIVRIDRTGQVSDFVPSRGGGIWNVLGMKVDPKRRLLWTASSASDARFGQDNGTAGLFAFDLSTGKLVRKYVVDAKSGPHLFNDLDFAPNGDVHVTDSLRGTVYRVANGADKAEEILPPNTFWYPNGLIVTPDGARLLVASDTAGISVVDLKTKAMSLLLRPIDISTQGIDGMYLRGRSIIAVQNGLGPGRIMRYELSPGLDRVEKAVVLESRNPKFKIPTTGALAGDHFYFIANAQVDQINDNGTIKDEKALQDVLISKLKVD
ncbi:MAG TPA: SMP-30/gluconolactonase/LRE family protein [Terriglobales bacterium]|nr:SMP-30/gluconolactonase/LRE family protein [Terriglobales bacterium]